MILKYYKVVDRVRGNMKEDKSVSLVRKGFTLVEVMVVLVIIGLMATALVPKILDSVDKGRQTKAQTDIYTFSNALKLYKLDNGHYPSTEQGLQALVEKPTTEPEARSWKTGGYIEVKEKTLPKDPWESDYIYRSPGEDDADFDIISLGADRQEGGEGYNADITN